MTTREVEEQPHQRRTETDALPLILNDHRKFAGHVLRLPINPSDCDNLRAVLGIKRDDRKSLDPVQLSEIPCALVAEVRNELEKPEIDRSFTESMVEALQRLRVTWLDEAGRDLDAI